jgi:hypothetical protein
MLCYAKDSSLFFASHCSHHRSSQIDVSCQTDPTPNDPVDIRITCLPASHISVGLRRTSAGAFWVIGLRSDAGNTVLFDAGDFLDCSINQTTEQSNNTISHTILVPESINLNGLRHTLSWGCFHLRTNE